MKILLVLFVAGLYCNCGHAINSEDPMIQLGTGTKFVATKDIQIPANTEELDLSGHRCTLLFKNSTELRVWKKGYGIEISGGKTISYPTFDSTSSLLTFRNPSIIGLRCNKPAGWGDLYFSLNQSELVEAVDGFFQIFEAAPTSVESESICK